MLLILSTTSSFQLILVKNIQEMFIERIIPRLINLPDLFNSSE